MPPTDHSHGIIQSGGTVNNSSNEFLKTDKYGKITTTTVGIPEPNDNLANITMNQGEFGAIGTSNLYARADHIHPSDTSKSNTGHKHPVSDIEGLGNLPSSAHSHGIIKNDGTVDSFYANKFVITDTNGNITTATINIPQGETDKNYIKMNKSSAEAGNSTKFAKADHVHPSDNSKSNIGHKHSIDDINHFPTQMTPTSHTHGNITNEGKMNGVTAVKNIITDASGNITTETVNKYKWLSAQNTADDVSELPFAGTSVRTNGHIKTCYVNRGIRLVFIRIELSVTDNSHKKVTQGNKTYYPGIDNWYYTDVILPPIISPTWTQMLHSEIPGHKIKLMDDDTNQEMTNVGNGKSYSLKRRIVYYIDSKSPDIDNIKASGFYFYTNKGQ
jgi:hypothetical protein